MQSLVYLKSKMKKKNKKEKQAIKQNKSHFSVNSGFKDISVSKIKDLFSWLESQNFGRKVIYWNRKIMSVNLCTAPIHFPSFPQIASNSYKYLNFSECKWPHQKINISTQNLVILYKYIIS